MKKRAAETVELHDWYEIEVDGEKRLFMVTCLIWGAPFGRWNGDGPGPIQMDLKLPRRRVSAPVAQETIEGHSGGGAEEIDPLRRG